MKQPQFSLQELADRLDAELVGEPNYPITDVADLASATSSDASYLTVHPFGGAITNYESVMQESKAGVIVIGKDRPIPEGKQLLRVEHPSRAFQQLIEIFRTEISSAFTGVHSTAVIHPSAKLGDNVTVGPHAVIDQQVTIGAGSTIGAHGYIGAQTQIGKNCHLHPRVTIREGCQIGNRVILQPGVVIGSCGYGYFTDKQGHHTKLKQLGTVIVEDDVEIGANTTIDRARFQATIVKRGTKIDNLVMIAHGVELGEDNLIVSQVGIAGSTKTGSHVVMGGQAGVVGHIEISDNVLIAARAGVIGSLKEAGQYYGEPARPKAEARRYYMRLMALEKYFNRIKELEKRVDELESTQS